MTSDEWLTSVTSWLPGGGHVARNIWLIKRRSPGFVARPAGGGATGAALYGLERAVLIGTVTPLIAN